MTDEEAIGSLERFVMWALKSSVVMAGLPVPGGASEENKTRIQRQIRAVTRAIAGFDPKATTPQKEADDGGVSQAVAECMIIDRAEATAARQHDPMGAAREILAFARSVDEALAANLCDGEDPHLQLVEAVQEFREGRQAVGRYIVDCLLSGDLPAVGDRRKAEMEVTKAKMRRFRRERRQRR